MKLRVLSDEDDNFLRDYEVNSDISLKRLHDFVCEDLGYDPHELSSFFTSDDKWEKHYEFTSIDMGFDDDDVEGAHGPMTMDNVMLMQIAKEQGDRLIYTFDQLGDRSLFFEVMDIYKAKGGFDYPRVQLANGDAPDQYDEEAGGHSNSIFDEAMGDYNYFEGDDYYSDDE